MLIRPKEVLEIRYQDHNPEEQLVCRLVVYNKLHQSGLLELDLQIVQFVDFQQI